MSITLLSLETKTRNLIGDIEESSYDVFTYGSSNVFTLSESNVVSVDDVSINDVSSGVSYTYNATTNKVTINTSMLVGDVVKVQMSVYSNYSSTEIQGYIQAAITFLSVYNYYTWEVIDNVVYPEPEISEQNLIAMVAALIIEPDNKSYRLPEIGISVPKDVPLHQKIAALVASYKKNSHGILEILENTQIE